MCFIDDPRKWRLSKSGFTIRTGWADEKRLVAAYPGATAPLDPKQFSEWLANAEKICELYNAALAEEPQPANAERPVIAGAQVDNESPEPGDGAPVRCVVRRGDEERAV